jgi:hypothetical protein
VACEGWFVVGLLLAEECPRESAALIQQLIESLHDVGVLDNDLAIAGLTRREQG